MANFVSRQVEVRGVVFVVNILDMNDSKNDEVVNWLGSLESESSLARSKFAVLFNGSQELIRGENYENLLKKLEPFSLRLGERFMCRNVNTIMGLSDPGWTVTLDFMISLSSREKKKPNKNLKD
ncbi:ADP-ribosylation factor [Theileria orientalis]|uniref:ADP-ribosylation factor n=1 Tax=Theileria orientalis TaxID=68886 RepID=A0A976M7F0_THEOR|nr:ADP-ribosylation factor [Theileria orientalis]